MKIAIGKFVAQLGLRPLAHVAGHHDHLHAALLELSLQPAEFQQVLQADRAMQATVEDDEGEVRRCVFAEGEEAMVQRGHAQCRYGLARHQGRRRGQRRGSGGLGAHAVPRKSIDTGTVVAELR